MEEDDQFMRLAETLYDLATANGAEEWKAFLESHPELQTAQADRVIGWMLDQWHGPEFKEIVQRLVYARTVLRLVRDLGLERTFEYIISRQRDALSSAPTLVEELRRAATSALIASPRICRTFTSNARNQARSEPKAERSLNDFGNTPQANRARLY